MAESKSDGYGFPAKWKRVLVQGKEIHEQIRGGREKTLMSVWGVGALKNRFILNPFSRQPAFNGFGTLRIKPRWTVTAFKITVHQPTDERR